MFHYTDVNGAFGISFTRTMRSSVAWPGLPRGAYATDIAPWDPSYTKTLLAEVFYFSPRRRRDVLRGGKLDWFVALCNDVDPLFRPVVGYPHQYVKPNGGRVNPIAFGLNPMAG